MTKDIQASLALLSAAFLCVISASAQYSTPPATAADIEQAYTTAIEKRTADILNALALPDPAKSDKVHDVIIAQYRALKARDEAIDTKLKAAGKEAGDTNVYRAGLFQTMSKPLHEQFLAKLAGELSPEQIEKVKDKMTYNKVQVTYDAYGVIVPGLTDKEKARILALLKDAREEAIDGGSAKEKSDIFQKYKDRVNDYLNAQGHDVAKAYRDWNAKQELEKKQKEEQAAKATQATK